MSLFGRNGGDAPAGILGPRIMLVLTVLVLTLIGFVMIYSASSVSILSDAASKGALSSANPAAYLLDQLFFAVIGVVCAFALWRFFPIDTWMDSKWLWIVYGAGILGLILTAVMGTTALGAQRWLSIGPVSLQPSEFAKITLVLMAANIFAQLENGELEPRDALVWAFVTIVLPLLFLYMTQSDLGTSAIIAVGVLAVMWIGEVPTRVIVAIVIGLGLFGLVGIFGTGYRSDRLVVYNPWNDGDNGYGSGYQTIHSFYAFSEGGLFGVGLGNSREKFDYLPEAETDFVFSIIGEEFGLVGALFVIGLFLVLLYAGMQIAHASPTPFGAMVAGSCTIMLVFQAFLNIGCVIGLVPTTGKPLPFVSSGGSSLIATFIMVGLILSVSRAADAPSVYERRRADLRVVRASGGKDSDVPARARRSRARR